DIRRVCDHLTSTQEGDRGMNDDPMTTRVPARRVFVAALGAAALLAATASRAQDSRPATKDMRPKTSDRAPGANRGAAAPARASGAADRDPRADDDDLDPALAEALAQARIRVERLEAQLEAKRARIELAEARLKRAQAQLAQLRPQGDGAAAQ